MFFNDWICRSIPGPPSHKTDILEIRIKITVLSGELRFLVQEIGQSCRTSRETKEPFW